MTLGAKLRSDRAWWAILDLQSGWCAALPDYLSDTAIAAADAEDAKTTASADAETKGRAAMWGMTP